MGLMLLYNISAERKDGSPIIPHNKRASVGTATETNAAPRPRKRLYSEGFSPYHPLRCGEKSYISETEKKKGL